MEKFLSKRDLCQVSLTGIRALTLLGLLIQAPRSLEEIKEEFVKHNIMDESNSYDILRIDINTLKTMGCQISRADKRTDNKYVLLKQPFELELNDNEIKLLKRALNKVKETADIDFLLKCDELFKKIAQNMTDANTKEILIGLSPLKKYKVELINALKSDCQNKNVLTLCYKSPTSKMVEEKEIAAQSLEFKNDKIYLYGYDKFKKESVTLNIKRILKILSRSGSDSTIESKPIKIKFKLTSFGISGLDENEKIISGDIQEGFVIEGIYHNEFVATQRMLSFGPACTVCEPQDFKERIVKVLKEMREIYNG